MILRILLLIAISIQSISTVYADCPIEFDKTKNEGLFNPRTNLGQVPSRSDDHYGYHMVSSWSQMADTEPKAKNPRIYFYDKKKCEILKVVELYPKNTYLTVGSEYYGVSFNKSLNLIYVTSLASGIYPNETKYYNYTEIYSYEDLKLINRIEGETPLANAELIEGGKEIIKVDYSEVQNDGPRIVISTADNFHVLKRSDPITGSIFEQLGILPQHLIRFFNIDFAEFMPGSDLAKMGEQWVVQLIGQDSNNEFRGVGFTLEGNPLYGVSYSNGQISKDPIEVYEKKFDLKVDPIVFEDIQQSQEKKKLSQEVEKKSLSSEPTPVIEP
jgi:hypothetical protein